MNPIQNTGVTGQGHVSGQNLVNTGVTGQTHLGTGLGGQNIIPGSVSNTVLNSHIGQETLTQHAAQLRGHDVTTGVGMLGQPGMVGQPGMTGLTHGMQDMSLGQQGLIHGVQQAVPVMTTGVMTQQVPATTIVPVYTHGLEVVQPGTKSHHKGTNMGTGVGTGLAATALGTGLAGTSQIPVNNMVPQGNLHHADPVSTNTGLLQTNVLATHNVPGNTTAQGQFTFKPLQAKFIKDNDIIGRMDPYVKVKLGWHSGKSTVAKGEGVAPTWTDAITLPRKHNETFAKLKVNDKDKVKRDDRLGAVSINLDEVVQRGRVTQWYPLTTRKGIPAGEILVEVDYAPLFIH